MGNQNTITAVNLWKEVRHEIGQELSSLKQLSLLLHDSRNFEDIIYVLNQLPGNPEVVYISFTKPFKLIKKSMPDIKPKLFVIDCISTSLYEEIKSDDCVYFPNPNDFEAMERLIHLAAEKMKPKYIVVDSLSQFTDFTSYRSDQTEFRVLCSNLRMNFSTNPDYPKIIFIYDEKHPRHLVNIPRIDVDTILRIESFRDIM